MKYWTEYEAWEYLAWLWRVIGEGSLRATGFYAPAAWGICVEIDELAGVALLFRPRHISVKTARVMRRRLPRRRPDRLCWPLTALGNRSRLAFCRRMARETQPPAGRIGAGGRGA